MSTEEHVYNTPQAEPKVSFMRKVRIVFVTILVIVLASFVIQNYNVTPINILAWTFNIRTVVVILASAIIGALITLLLLKNKLSKRK